jgi:LacI family transcriptional regulator
MAASLDRVPEAERDLVAAFASRRVDGLILGPTAREQGYLATELRSGWPIVCIDREPRGVEVDVVLTNNREATRAGVEHLLARGHRSIGYIGGDSILSTAHERHAGYLDAMAAAGAVVRPEWVAFDAHTADEAQAVAARFLSGSQAPTALFTAQNLITMGAVRALRAIGRHHDIALVGFDDFMLADLLEPAVTVVAQDPRGMGHLAAEILFRRMANSAEPIATHVIESRVIPRGSGEIPPA